MAEELKQVIDVLAALPAFTMWGLAGFALFKLVVYLSTTGAIVLISKLLIERLFQAFKVHVDRPEKPLPPREVSIDKHFITLDGTYAEFVSLVVRNLKNQGRGKRHVSPYIHMQDVCWFAEAIDEKKLRDAENAKP